VAECIVAGCSWRTGAAAVFTSILLAGTCLSPVAVAQTWTGGAGTSDWSTASNWTPATVPNGHNAVAQFGASGTSIINATDITVGSLLFNAVPGAPNYTMYFSGINNLNGSGIVGATSTQTFVLSGDTSLNFNGNGATAGNSRIVVQDYAYVVFNAGSSLGSATLVIGNGQAGFLGASLGTGVIQNGGSVVLKTDHRGSQPDGSRATYIGSNGNAILIISTPSSLASIQGSGSIALYSPLTVGGSNASTTFSGQIFDAGSSSSLTKLGTGTLLLTNDGNSFGGLNVLGGMVGFTSLGALGRGPILLNGGGLQWAPGNTSDVSQKLNPLGPNGGVFDTNGNDVTLAGAITGSGALTKAGAGTLTLTGANTYSGSTVVSAGVLAGNSTSLQGNIVNNASVVFNQTGTGTYAGVMSGTGSMTLQGGGILTITNNSTYSGTTTVSASKLVVNGSIANSTVILTSGGILGGSGTVGHVTVVDGQIAPGNSIGTLNIAGTLSKTRGHYHLEVNGAGQGDRINVGGTATVNGTRVRLTAEPGIYPNSTTYTILSAAGGFTGAYSGVVSDLAFLTPTLSYDANNAYLTLALQGAAFSGFSGNTPNQRAVGYALDQSYASASGDYATVIGALAGLSTAQGPAALSAISSQPWANFGTTNLASNALFMNTLGQQMAMARGGTASASGGQRQALAQACDVAACDSASPFSVWGSALGGTGSALGNGNTATLTYTLGGGAAGIDYRVTPNILLGIGAAYTSGTQWADGFMGKGWNNAVSVAAYGSFTQSGFYADLLAGYAYANNQLQRQIMVPNLQPRTANGSTGVNQFLGQAELGYQIPVYAPASATVTPFGRLQVMSVNQAAFSEWGANSLSLNVAQQTTNSVRSTLGMDLAGAIGLANGRSFDIALRLGWLHEYADVSRPITAAFAGAPGAAFTVYGATGQRDAAVIGFQAGTTVSDGAQIYVRYDGDIGTSASNHALSAGLRLAF
jgi:autotransporter-associated beta strand protein